MSSDSEDDDELELEELELDELEEDSSEEEEDSSDELSELDSAGVRLEDVGSTLMLQAAKALIAATERSNKNCFFIVVPSFSLSKKLHS